MRAIQRHRILQADSNTYKEKTTSKTINNNPIIQTRHSENQIYNIGGTTYSLAEAAQEIAKYFNATIEYIPYPEDDLKIESGSTFFNSTKLEALIRYTDYQNLDTLFNNKKI